MKKFGFILFCIFVVGCESNVYHDVSERSANEMVVALESAGIESGKSPGTSTELWNVHVAAGARNHALKTLASAGLPKPETKGYDAFYPSEGLIPTADEEHVLQQFALSEEIRKSLLTVDGIMDAQVNLVIPRRSKLRIHSENAEPSRASVVLKHRGETPPLTPEQVRTLVSGSVSGMKSSDVFVIATPSTFASGQDVEPSIVSVGPFAVAAASKTPVLVAFCVLIGIILVLAAALVAVLVRRRA